MVVSLRAGVFLVCCESVCGWLVRGRVGDRLEFLESGEGPCALVLAQERTRSIYDRESGEVFFIDVESDTQIMIVVPGGGWKGS